MQVPGSGETPCSCDLISLGAAVPRLLSDTLFYSPGGKDMLTCVVGGSTLIGPDLTRTLCTPITK